MEFGAGWGAYKKGAVTIHLDFMTSYGSKDRGSHVLGYSVLSFPPFPATYTKWEELWNSGSHVSFQVCPTQTTVLSAKSPIAAFSDPWTVESASTISDFINHQRISAR